MADLKFGTCDGKENITFTEGAFGSSQVLPSKSGRFVVKASGASIWTAAADNAVKLGGYLEESLTTSAISGETKLPVIDLRGRTFELPYAAAGAAATLTEVVGITIIKKLIPLYVDGNSNQYANNAAGGGILRIEAFSVANNTLKVSVIDSAISET